MRKSLTRAERLKARADFDRVFTKGSRIQGRSSRLLVLANGLDHNRFAVCPVRKYGTAVERNRAKRICREAYRNLKLEIETGYDIVFVIYPAGKAGGSAQERTDEYSVRGAQLFEMSDRAGIRRQNG